MATTALFAEILVIGFQAAVWVALLTLSVFGADRVPLDSLREWQAILIIPLLSAVYAIGVLVDRVADTLFDTFRGREKKPRKEDTTGFRSKRLRVLMEENGAAKFVEYQRSRLRIARGTVFNTALILITIVVFLSTRTESSGRDIAAAAGLVAALLAVSVLAARRIDKSQAQNVEEAYELISDRQSATTEQTTSG